MANITTRDEAKVYLGITDSSKDALIDLLLPSVDSQFERWTNRTFVRRSAQVERYNGRGSPFLYTRGAPIIQVNTLKLIDPSDGGAVETFTAADFQIKGRTPQSTGEYIELIQSQGFANPFARPWNVFFPVGTNNVEIDYDYGFADTLAPADVKLAAWMHIGMHVKNPPTGMESERISKYSYKRSTTSELAKGGLSKEVTDMLRPYKRVEIEFAGRPVVPRDPERRFRG